MTISSLADLEKLESRLALEFRKIKLGDVLHSLYLLRKQSAEPKPFIAAGVALFAARFSPHSQTSQSIKTYDISHLINFVTEYLLADPITFDQVLHNEFIDSNPVFMLLRLASSQFPFNPGLFSEFSRPFLLYHEIPNKLKDVENIPSFDFEGKFQSVTGVSVIDFITTGFVIFAAANRNFAINQDYFKKARKQGINIPDDKSIVHILEHFTADKFKLIELYEKRKNKDPRFKMYNFNPFISYPLIKPCQYKQFSPSNQNFIHAPVPELIGSRISTGIFYQMYNAYTTEAHTEFSNYFGFIFERYVGLVLENCIVSEQLLSELDIRVFYPTTKGKVPDWILIDGSTMILLECKATRFSRAAQEIASEDAVNSSLSQVKKGLKQLASFISACQAKISDLQQFHHCTTFKPILVSLEPLHLINSTFFREHIDNLLASEGVPRFNWQILSIDELEVLQPHMAVGIRLSQVLDNLLQKTFNDVLQELISQTNRTFAHSFLYQRQEELYKSLGIPD